MIRPSCNLFRPIIKAGLVCASAAYILLFLVIALNHVFYPFELEWMEGGMAQMMQRVLDGMPLYAEPTIDYTPYTYAPLYFHLSAWLARWTGPGFMPMRMISLLSTIGCMILAAHFTFRITKSALFALFVAGLLAAMFRLGGTWFALARTDMPMFFLILLALDWLYDDQGAWWRVPAAALCFVAAFHIKQTALVIAMPIALFLLIFQKGWRRIFFPALLAIVLPAITHAANRASGGWYSFFMFELPSSHHLVLSRFISFWLMDLMRPLFIMLAIGALYLALLARQKNWRTFGFAGLSMGGLLGAAWIVRMQSATYVNTVLPAYIGIAFFSGAAAAALYREAQDWRSTEAWNPLPDILLAACLAQLLALFYDPTVLVPTCEDRAAGERLIALIQQFEGPVYLPAHGHYAVMAGKPPHAQQVACDDVIAGKNRERADLFSAHIATRIQSGYYDAVILSHPWQLQALSGLYEYHGDVFDNDEVFWPVTGRRMRPKSIYVRRDRQSRRAGGPIVNGGATQLPPPPEPTN